jgi:hypothetical protein
MAGDNDTGDKFNAGDKKQDTMEVGRCQGEEKAEGTDRGYLLLPKSDTAADGVIGTAMKSCIYRYPTNPNQRPLRLPKLNNAVLV